MCDLGRWEWEGKDSQNVVSILLQFLPHEVNYAGSVILLMLRQAGRSAISFIAGCSY